MNFTSFTRRWFAVAFVLTGLGVGLQQALAQRPLGIDVSSYQGSGVNWTSVKSSGRVFAWAKATEGTSVADADFTINESNGKSAGVYMGAYHYAHPELNTPASEASYFWSIAGSYILADGKTFMPMLDIEGNAFNGNVGASSLSDWINQWCTDVLQDAANAGVSVKPVIYISACNACYLNNTVDQWFSDIANYGGTDGDNDPTNGTPWSACTSCEVWGSGVWTVWQYASAPPDGSVPGVSGNCDVDVFNGTLASLQNTMLATPSASSAIFYWDPQGTGGGNPYTGSMTGTWENKEWSYTSAGLAGPTNWIEGKAVCFGVHTGTNTPAYTVTMNSSHVVAGFFDGGLAPNACDVTITGAGIIDLASGAQALDARNASDGSLAYLRINCVIDGNGQLYPEGNGQSFLNASNTFTGGVTLGYPGVPFSGIVNFNNGSAFGTGPIVFTNTGNGGALLLEGVAAVTVTNSVSVTSATTNNIVGNAAGLTFSGNWSLGGNLFTMGTGSTTGNQDIISGVVSGTAGLTIYNSGTLVLSGVNTYSGTTSINSPAVLTLAGAGQLGSGSYSGSIVNNGTFNYNSSAAQTLSGVISGAGSLNQTAGALVLRGANSYTGSTTISGGTLQLGANNSIPSGSSVLLANGATLDLNGKSDSIATLSGPLGATLPAGNVINNNSTLTLNGTAVANAGEAGSSAYSGVISGSGNVVVSGGGSITLSGSNTYAGTTTVSGGTLVPSYNGTLPPGSAVTVNSPGLFDLASVNESIASLAGSGTVNLESGTLSVGSGNTSTTFSGVIRNAAAPYTNGVSINGLQGFYFPAVNFSGQPIIRVDSTVNFGNLATNTQPLYPQITEFSIRWIGQVLTTTAGTYTFTTTSDDGTRCWVNGQLVVDNWNFQPATARSGTISLAAGTVYDLRVEYEQGGGGASCVLAWTPPGGASAVIPNSNLFTYAGVGGLTKMGTGTLTLSGSNTYTGNTAINAGTLALGSSGSINNTPTISVAAGATLDVSAIGSYSLSGSSSLSAAGTSVAATINGGSTVSLGSQPITLTYDGADPALTISHGILSLNGNPFTVNGPLLAGGNIYTLVQQASGAISTSGTYSVSGTAIGAPGTTAAVSVTGGSVLLAIIDATTTTLNSLNSATYGQPVALTATVAPAPSGGTVQFYDNSVPLGGPVMVSNGIASYVTSSLAVGSHPITASYGGVAAYAASSTSGASTQTVSQAGLNITASPQTKTYGTLLTFGSGSTNFSSAGLQNGESVGTVTLAVSGNGGATNAPVGTYTITPSAATGGTFDPDNYSIIYNPGSLTVTLPPNTIPVTITGATLLTGGAVRLDFVGTPGYVYLLEAATRLAPLPDWTVLSTNAADDDGTFSFTDLGATNFNCRYYRTATQ